MMSETVSVRLPNGNVLIADLGGLRGDGYRTASVRVTTTRGRQVRVSGRVTTRHGYDRTLPFEINMIGTNARSALATGGEEIFVRAA